MADGSLDTASMAMRPRASAPPGTAASLTTLIYRSRAVGPLSGPELRALIRNAQARNQREAITGLVLYDDSRFFQWLEGPAESLARVMGSIRDDPRHTDIEVLSQHPTAARRFVGWDMKLATLGAESVLWRGEVLEPPRALLDALRRRPGTAASVLVPLVVPLPAPGSGSAQAGQVLGRSAAAVLKNLIVETVIPRLARSHGVLAPAAAPPATHPRATELAELLVGPDEAASLALIRAIRGEVGDPRHLYAPLFEPAARDLGALWAADRCSEFEVALGLCRLQSAVRLLGQDAPRAAPREVMPTVLIAPAPGEAHSLVATLDSEWLWQAGWATQTEYPADDGALGELLSAAWIDVLDLSLSAAFRRVEQLPRLSRSIAQARRASRNPGLMVVVGGRVFVEDGRISLDVGADVASRTSRNLDRVMLDGLAMVERRR